MIKAALPYQNVYKIRGGKEESGPVPGTLQLVSDLASITFFMRSPIYSVPELVL